ncbi:MAG: hypothetical protein CO156_04940 [Candidatus Pacebacteria bacterium CG_4_9_14_3_um_filter_40_12]|nr:MAG: hypothetical protein COU64_05210 [Candidatus Pacebacteria bacterium CG10_big_fil_rev_8_21_14_0_10_40_26]PIZ79005.1 MAG: hypothetical protein COY01_01080 [Candidatus Pacebacteria bacterium CG_4_10_14_0_2_um_filter_40_20]PJA68549.1 MAG: hypothetical protein CO156_04940 [Candidatus Pacebacteria bacterium CG_4_9_14_3_um_filter_40_12]PJC41933.1 MAG: hypothetical protein CO041_02190 [Candidatus Pacebacteria bacterium CG_4_9_14_0_2_um_filter_40_15]
MLQYMPMPRPKELTIRGETQLLEKRHLKKATKLGEFIRNRVSDFLSNRVTIQVEGEKNLEVLHHTGAILAVLPHNGHIDTGILRAALEEELRKNLFFIAGADYWHKAVLSEDDSIKEKIAKIVTTAFLKTVGPAGARIFPIDRFNRDQSNYDLEQIAERTLHGEFAVFYPEGTRRNWGKPLSEREFKTGIGHVILLTEGKVPVIPIYLEGNENLLPPDSKRPHFNDEAGKPHTVIVHIGEALDFSSFIPENPKEMGYKEVRAFRNMTTSALKGHFLGKYDDSDDVLKHVPKY